MSGRSVRLYECQGCGKMWHPTYGSKKLYCSPKCVGRGFGINREVAAQAKAAAFVARIPIADDIAYLRSLPDLNPDEDDEDDEDDDDKGLSS